MIAKFKDPDIPKSIKIVSILIILYGLAVLISALIFGALTHFANTKGLIGAIIRCGGMSLLAIWLLTLDKKAWWVCLIICTFFCLLGATAIGSFLYLALTDIGFNYGILINIANLSLLLYLLGHATLILVRKSTRVHFS